MKKFLNGVALLIGLGLIGYSFLKRPAEQIPAGSPSPQTSELPETKPQTYEEWSLKPGSIYDGDTLRVVKGNEELKIRFCGIDAPEKDQELGIEARDHLRSLIELGNGELLLVPVEKDRYGRTVAEVYVQDSKNSAVNLNMQMIRDGYAWLYAQYVDNCPSKKQLEIAESLAQEESLGVWSNGSSIPPWEWRKALK
jgi:endonuclease YncB( thermonuclease family)